MRDLNNDGFDDLAFSLNNATVAIYLCNGDVTFAAPITIPYSPGAGGGAIIPFNENGDSAIDLAVVNQSAGIVNVIRNLGGGSFVSLPSVTTGSVLPTELASGDLNRDGRADLVVTNIVTCCSGSNDISVMWKSAAQPRITQQPTNVVAPVGGDATFSIVAAGAGPFTYQWQKNGVNVGSNSPSYTLSSATQSDDNATVVCRVTNSCGSSTSQTATLSVIDATCDADFNLDGGIDLSDVFDLANVVAGGSCP